MNVNFKRRFEGEDPNPAPAADTPQYVTVDQFKQMFGDFSKQLLSDINKTTKPPAAAPPPLPKQEGKPDVKANDEKLMADRRIAEMEAQVQELQAKNARDAEANLQIRKEAEVNKAIDKAIGTDRRFVTPEARDSVRQLLLNDIKVLDDGSLVAGDNLSVGAFAADAFKTRLSFALQPINGGTGFTPGTAGAGKALDLDDIKPGMTPEQIKEFGKQILHLQGN